jgi:hypothetical protein
MAAVARFEGEVFLENLDGLDRTGFAACAFFTPDARLERCARRLARSCERLGLPYSVSRAPAVHPSISMRGTGDLRFTKPSFIASNLDRLAGSDIAAGSWAGRSAPCETRRHGTGGCATEAGPCSDD